jgi:Nif-specific regulatory protein
VLELVQVASQAPLPVLFTGESGTGKSAFAHALHRTSPRRDMPFVEINCAAIPEALFESELFGAEKGAHSTATKRMSGKIEAAQGGTLFFDEIGEMPHAVQSKLLTFLQSRRYYRLGSTTPIDADVRIVAATNAELDELVRAKRFREDLFYRLNVLEIRVPPLRERREDVGEIASAVLAKLGPMTLSLASRVALAENDWPGNVRQLENVVQRGWAMANAEQATVLEPRHLFADKKEQSMNSDEPETYEDAMRRFQREFVRAALVKHGWNVSETARRIGVARSHLNEVIRAHGLVRER